MELGMLQTKEDGSFATQNEMRIPTEISNIHATVQGYHMKTLRKLLASLAVFLKVLAK